MTKFRYTGKDKGFAKKMGFDDGGSVGGSLGTLPSSDDGSDSGGSSATPNQSSSLPDNTNDPILSGKKPFVPKQNTPSKPVQNSDDSMNSNAWVVYDKGHPG